MSENKKSNACEAKKMWPKNCLWPEPMEDGAAAFWDADDAISLPLDEEAEELLGIKEYMDELILEGRLNEDYSLNEDYDDADGYSESFGEDEADAGFDGYDETDKAEWEPEKGVDYWDDGFDLYAWQEDLESHINLLKLPLPSPVDEIQRIIGYEFINENLLRQAFTRRAFTVENGTGDSEVLEFIGDTVLNTVVTREIARQLTEIDVIYPRRPFRSSYTEGDLSRIRQHYVCKEYLALRAAELGLDQYILYGSQEQPGENSREDMMEALIGAVAADCDWDWSVLENVADRLLCIQLKNPRSFLKNGYYDTFNAWHQKKFGRMPEYEITRGRPVGTGLKEYEYFCTLRFFVPENDKGIRTIQRVDISRETRSKAREMAAEMAYRFVVNSGLWMNLADAGIVPNTKDSINQLQELYHKKYVDQPEYSFELWEGDEWYCTCVCGGIQGFGRGIGKTPAKKKAAFMVLVRLMKSAGICKEEWIIDKQE